MFVSRMSYFFLDTVLLQSHGELLMLLLKNPETLCAGQLLLDLCALLQAKPDSMPKSFLMGPCPFPLFIPQSIAIGCLLGKLPSWCH